MFEFAIIATLFILFLLVIVLIIQLQKKSNTLPNSQQLIIDLNENLRKEMAEIRKNVEDASTSSRESMQSELSKINDDIKSFQQNGSQLTQLKQDDLLRPLYKKISDDFVKNIIIQCESP